MMQPITSDISQRDFSRRFGDTWAAMSAVSEPSPFYERLLALRPAELSDAAWARKAGVSSSFFQDVRKGRRPRIDNLMKVLDVIGVSEAQFWAFDAAPAPATPPAPGLSDVSIPFRTMDLPRDVPVLGTVEGADIQVGNNGDGHVESMRVQQGEIIDYLRRPPVLGKRRDVYGLEIVGTSMSPRYDPGDPIFVDSRRAPQIGDDAVVQLVEPDSDGEPQFVVALIKTLVARSASWIELKQYNPQMTFRIDRSRIAALHRVIPSRELFGS